jgi:hypothetical protein
MREWLERRTQRAGTSSSGLSEAQKLTLEPLEGELVALATRRNELHATNAAQAGLSASVG